MSWFALAILVAFAGLGGVLVWRVRSYAPPMPGANHGWSSDKVTPASLGPRSSAPERVARGAVLTQAVVVAVEMARADGTIRDVEVDAIRAFIRNHVPEADEELAKKVLEDAMRLAATEVAIDKAIETIRAVGSEDQRRLVVQLFIHVAHIDGQLDPAERAFMERVGQGLGLALDSVRDLIDHPLASA